MNLFDYRNKKDLQGRTTEFRNAGRPGQQASRPAPNAPGNGGTTKVQAQQMGTARTRSRRRLRNATKDRWYYFNNLQSYNQQASGNRSESANLANDTQVELRRKYGNLLNDWFANEIIKEVRRRDPIHIIYIAKPAWLLFPLVVVSGILTILFPLALYAFLPLLVFELLLVAWYVNDWSNDYLIITNRRIVQIERITFLDSEKTEIPLEKVQEVKVVARRSALEYLFQVGTVTFTSSGKTQIKFQQVKKPEELRTVVEGMTRSFFMARNSFRKDRTRNYLEAKITGTQPKDWFADEETRIHSSEEEPGWWQRTFPSHAVHDPANKRYIWYTHPWILFKQIFLPGLLMFLLLVGGIFGIPFLFSLKLGVLTGVIILVYLLILLVLLGVIWYKYENWHNDRYILTYAPFQEKVMNIVRLPFGFDETVNTVLVRNIQDVQSEKSGIVATFFNFGRVKISVTGGPGIEVKNVPDPEEIRDEISRRIEIAKLNQEDVEDRRMADSLVALRDIMYKEIFQMWQTEQPSNPERPRPQ